jgi:hypothetical protein
MTRLLKHGVPALLVLITLLWAGENLYFMKQASPQARKACAGQTSFFGGPNSYYWCLRRVEAGGKP